LNWQALARAGDVLMRKIVAAATLASALILGACNTIEGAGKDVSSAGNTVAKTADDAK
jgi:predicted small secreted protein